MPTNKTILDLSQQPQSRHKASSKTPISSKPPQPEVPLPSQRAKQRMNRAASVKKHPTVTKFPNLAFRTSKSLGGKTDTRAMNAHRSYSLHRPSGADRVKSEAAYVLAPAAKITKLSGKDIERLTTTPNRQGSTILGWLKRHRRLAVSGTIIVAAIIITAYVSYLNVPAFSLRVAAVRAGLDSASLPVNLPANFSFSGPVHVVGHHTIEAKAVGPSDQTLIITEQSTSYIDTQSLIANFIKPLTSCQVSIDQCISEHNNNGLSIILFNRNNAAWIYGSVLYAIRGQNSLTPDQVLDLATSF